MRELITTAQNALGLKKFVIMTTAGGVVAIYALARSRFPQLPDLPVWQLYALALLAFLSWSALAYAGGLEDKFKPQISIDLDYAVEAVTKQIAYVHLVVASKNEAQIARCAIALLHATDGERSAPFSSPIRLVTAGKHEEFATVYPRIPQHFDLLLTGIFGTKSVIDVAPGATRPQRLDGFFYSPGTYWLTAAVSADNTPTVTTRIKVKWNGMWDALRVDLVN